jgi:hypothetical protein
MLERLQRRICEWTVSLAVTQLPSPQSNPA